MKVARSVRKIGPAGTVARALVGTGMLVAAAVARPTGLDVLWGLVVFPGVVLVALSLRGRDAPALRIHGPLGHVLTLSIFVALLTWMPVPTLLFYGVSMLLAAWRGYSACELFAASNLLMGRDDELGCPLFFPVDAAETRLTGRGRS